MDVGGCRSTVVDMGGCRKTVVDGVVVVVVGGGGSPHSPRTIDHAKHRNTKTVVTNQSWLLCLRLCTAAVPVKTDPLVLLKCFGIWK